MLKLKNVSKYYHANEVVALGLRKINLEFDLGEFIAVTGESGSGKSTLLNVISGLDTYEDGEMYVDGEETSYFSVEDWEGYRRQYIGFVFQNYNIIDSYSVLENVMVALQIQGYDKSKRKERAIELIKRVGLESHTHHKASKLSGGQKQRAVIARALAKDCPIIVCDEPTGNLDSESSSKVMSLLSEIAHDKLVIVVTHNYDEVAEYATRKIRLFDGEVVEDEKMSVTPIVESKTQITPYIMNYWNLIQVSFKNLLRTPRRSIFSTTVFIFITLIFALTYGLFVSVTNEAGGSEYNSVFSNVTDNRIIVTTYDEVPLTPEDLTTLLGINRVIDVYEHDVVNDSLVHQYTIDGEEDWKWINSRPLYINPAFVLQDSEIVEGRLPESEFEIVLEASKSLDIGDKVYFGFDYLYIQNEMGETIDYDQYVKDHSFEFTIVGFTNEKRLYSWEGMAFFHKDFLYNMEVINKAYLSSQWRSPYQINVLYNNMDILRMSQQTLLIDNSLEENEFVVTDNVIREFEWIMMEQNPEFDFDANPDYYKTLDLTVVSTSSFVTNTFDINISNTFIPENENIWYAVKMSQVTYDKLFTTDTYQATVYVKDAYDGKLVKEAIENIGYNAIYPRNVEDPFTALSRIILTVVFGFLMLLLMGLMYFITYFVLRNIQQSKKKDYLIFRSIGASKTSLKKVSLIELLISTAFSYAFVILLLLLNSRFLVIRGLANLMSYYTVGNYFFLMFLLVALSFLLGWTFNNRIFEKSVISSLKAE